MNQFKNFVQLHCFKQWPIGYTLSIFLNSNFKKNYETVVSPTETIYMTADHVGRSKFPINRAIIYHLSRDNILVIER